MNGHHVHGLSPFSQTWQCGLRLGLPSLIFHKASDDLAWWTVGLGTLIRRLKPGKRCGTVLVGSPVARLLGFYGPLWKLPSAIFLFVWLTTESLSRLPSLLYVCPSMQRSDVLVVFSIYVFYATCTFHHECKSLTVRLFSQNSAEASESFSTVPWQ